MATEPLYRVYKCRYRHCESFWIDAGDSKDPRCHVCGGSVPYRSAAVPQKVALAHLNSLDITKPLTTPMEAIATASLNVLHTRISSERGWANEQAQLLRCFYEGIQGVYS